MYRDVLRLLNGVLSFVEALLLIGCLLYAGYALWDNQQIYTSVSSLQNELLAFKPAEDADAAGPSFEDLQAINPDVCAWLTMDGTRIDYQIDQIQTNDNQTASGIIDLFVDCLVEKKEPEISGADVLHAMKAVFASIESSAKGCAIEVK